MQARRRVATVTVLGVLGLALLIPGAANAGTYTYCGTETNASGSCGPNNLWGAVWDKRKYERTSYKLCVSPPGRGKDCSRHRTSRRGYDAVSLFGRYSKRGTYKFRWRRDGRLIDRDSFYLTAGE